MLPLLLLVPLLSLAAVSRADKIPDFVVPGRCPAVDEAALWRHQTSQFASFGAEWYIYANTPIPFLPVLKCNKNYFNYDGRRFVAKTTGLDAEGKEVRMNGQLYPSPLGDPHLVIDYENVFAAPFVVLDTDYSNYACIYSCMDFNHNYYTDVAFIFSRKPDLPDQYLKKCESAFKDIEVDTSRFLKVPQGSFCSYDKLKSI